MILRQQREQHRRRRRHSGHDYLYDEIGIYATSTYLNLRRYEVGMAWPILGVSDFSAPISSYHIHRLTFARPKRPERRSEKLDRRTARTYTTTSNPNNLKSIKLPVEKAEKKVARWAKEVWSQAKTKLLEYNIIHQSVTSVDRGGLFFNSANFMEQDSRLRFPFPFFFFVVREMAAKVGQSRRWGGNRKREALRQFFIIFSKRTRYEWNRFGNTNQYKCRIRTRWLSIGFRPFRSRLRVEFRSNDLIDIS